METGYKAMVAGVMLLGLPTIERVAPLDAPGGKDVVRPLIANRDLQIIYAPREQQDANDYSEMPGYTTVRKQNIAREHDVSRSESDERRALILPQELKAMSFDKKVFLYEGIPQPVMCEKTKYYRGKYFTLRPRLRADVITLNLSRNAG